MTLGTIVYTMPLFICVVIPLSLFYWFILTIYVTTSRQLKRMELVSRSPLISHFGETFTGIKLILDSIVCNIT